MLFTAACGTLLYIPTGFEASVSASSRHAKARVVTADDSGIRSTRMIKTGTQVLDALFVNGEFEGRGVSVVNELKGSMEVDEIFRSGDTVLVEYARSDEGVVTAAFARGKYRLDLTLGLLALFGLLLVVTAGWTGAKALLSFAFALLMLWKVLFPALLRGYDPILITMAVAIALIGCVSFLVGGAGRKGLVTFLGSLLGLLLTCGLAMALTPRFGIHGAVLPFAPSLLYAGFFDIPLTRLFISGVFLAASGALMDVAMDIAASMDELIQKRPDMTMGEHIASGLAVGRSVVGTMATTLLLAYSSSYSAMLMVFMGQGVPLSNVFNLSHVSAEVLHTLVGSLGLVAVAPSTALVGGLVYRWGRRREASVALCP